MFRTDAPLAAALVPLPALRNFAASMAASTFATLLTQPVDIVRTRLQLRPAPGAGWTTGSVVLGAMRELVRREGAAALFTGGVSRVAKRSLSTAITWTLFEEAMGRSAGGGGG